MRHIAIPALALVLLGTYLPHAFSDDSLYTLGSSTGITTSQGLVIHILNITDSRCPSDVTCIWAGQVNVTLAVQGQNSKSIVSIIKSPGKDSTISFDNYTLHLVDVQPYPRSGHSISLEDYIVTLGISQPTPVSDKVRLVTDSKMCLAGVDTCFMAKKFHFSPMNQLRIGIGALDVTCKDGFGLVLKSTNNMPSCVKSSTADVLVQRGWALSPDEFTRLRMTYEPTS